MVPQGEQLYLPCPGRPAISLNVFYWADSMAIYENDETWMWCLSRTGRSSCALTCYVRKLVRQKRRIKHSYHRLTALRLFSWNHPIQKEFKVTHNWCFSLHMILSTLRIIKVWYSIQWLPVFKKQHHLGDRTKHTVNYSSNITVSYF